MVDGKLETIHCESRKSNPPPVLQWFLGDKQLRASVQVDIYESELQFLLFKQKSSMRLFVVFVFWTLNSLINKLGGLRLRITLISKHARFLGSSEYVLWTWNCYIWSSEQSHVCKRYKTRKSTISRAATGNLSQTRSTILPQFFFDQLLIRTYWNPKSRQGPAIGCRTMGQIKQECKETSETNVWAM